MNKQFFIPIMLMIFSLRYISLLSREECFDYRDRDREYNQQRLHVREFYVLCSFAAILREQGSFYRLLLRRQE